MATGGAVVTAAGGATVGAGAVGTVTTASGAGFAGSGVGAGWVAGVAVGAGVAPTGGLPSDGLDPADGGAPTTGVVGTDGVTVAEPLTAGAPGTAADGPTIVPAVGSIVVVGVVTVVDVPTVGAVVVVDSAIVVDTDPLGILLDALASGSASSAGSAARNEPIIGTIAANPVAAATVTAQRARRAGCGLRRICGRVNLPVETRSASRKSSSNAGASGGTDSIETAIGSGGGRAFGGGSATLADGVAVSATDAAGGIRLRAVGVGGGGSAGGTADAFAASDTAEAVGAGRHATSG